MRRTCGEGKNFETRIRHAKRAAGVGAIFSQKDNKYKSYSSFRLERAGKSHLQQGKYTPHRI